MLRTTLRGARTHNLKGASLTLDPGQLVVVTGPSGAGKSSLAMDTLYAEGQRRFIESFSPYVRQFLERLERPPVDELEPVPAGVAVDRRAPVKSSRSTVATMADLEPYLAALFARESRPVCPACGEEGRLRDPRQLAEEVRATLSSPRAIVTYPVSVGGSADYLALRDSLARDGYRRLWLGGEVRDLDDVRPSEVLVGRAEAEVVVDRVDVARGHARLAAALEEAWRRGDGAARIVDVASGAVRPATRGLSCPSCARALAEPRPSLFSYQSPVGACPRCKGFGRVIGVDWDKVFPEPELSLSKGAIRPWNGSSSKHERAVLARFCERRGISMTRPWGELSQAERAQVIDGEGTWNKGKYPGVRAWFTWLEGRTYKMHVRVLLSRFRSYDPCGACGGKRLNPEALSYRVLGRSLADVHALEIGDARRLMAELRCETGQGELARRELDGRLAYLEEVGLSYLSLDRAARTLSGGEAQRVSLTAALGTSLTGALFVLDEPTVGLHACDVPPLSRALQRLAARGNAVVCVEHDLDIVASAHRAIELGPGAGRQGGQILFDGAPRELARRRELPTGRALSGATRWTPTRRAPSAFLRVEGARANNLGDIDVEVPLGVVCAITGPSGSGKSTLAEDVIYRGVARKLRLPDVPPVGEHRALRGEAALRDAVLVDQSPLGRTSRGNAATYTKAWDRLRALFAATDAAKRASLTPAHFSFNVAAGRCEACAGEGSETIEMQFLADVTLPCPSCQGRRFSPEVLGVRYEGRDVAETLAMTVAEALAAHPGDAPLLRALRPLEALGLSYLPLGQPLSTLSGGEAQRLKLARALGARAEGALFVIDEPSAGLHAEDVGRVLSALFALRDAGASVLVVDHDLAVVRAADWLIDLGPGAGRGGGRIVATGTPDEVATRGIGKTAEALAARARRALARPPEVAPPPVAITVERAREHNLRDVSCALPLDALTVITGPSGSGKSTLAFDVVFAEGQRRFLETLTPYARQFLPMLPRADVDRVVGVPPCIALEQRTSRAGANSTVATVTEVAHYLRLLYAKVGDVHCPACDGPVAPLSEAVIHERLLARADAVTLLAPAVRARKGTHLDVFTRASRAGFAHAICDGERVTTDRPPRLKKALEHSISIVVLDGAKTSTLSRDALALALALGDGAVEVVPRRGARELLSTGRSCARCGAGVSELDPRWFSFNTKQGQCATCEGGGRDELGAPCAACGGSRLAPLPRGVRVGGLRYHELVARAVSEATAVVARWSFSGSAALIAEGAHRELARRLAFLDDVGLGYLSLDRDARSLSGGEMQRLRLAAQLGAGLTGALYVLDEPTIGLHPRDTSRLLDNLRKLVALGSTVVVVEHDEATIAAADHLIDLGPTGGRGGGRVMAEGRPGDVFVGDSPTAVALRQPFSPPRAPRGPAEGSLTLTGARGNNLTNLTLEIPRGRLVVVGGVSGSGKSTLVRGVLLPAVREALGLVNEAPPLPFDRLSGLGELRRALAVDQSPIGRSPRSVPATFLGVWDLVRALYAGTPDAKVAGFSSSRFSFNTPAGGRCEACDGQGAVTHEMSFLPDVITPCDACGGARFEPRTLEVRYLGLSIGDVLRLSASEAAAHFHAHPKISRPLSLLDELGVGYLQLGQGSHTLSGGEAQRLKLAAELTAGARHEPSLYVLDEPTTGLHLGDVAKLVEVLARLVDRGDTLVVIEHHPRVLASADHVIELGPDGGPRGGRIVATGAPRLVARGNTPTAKVIRDALR